MSKRHHLDGSALFLDPEPLGEADEGAGEPPFDAVDRKALDPARIVGVALGEDLQQRHRQARPFHDELFHVGHGPGHQLGLFDGFGPFGAARHV